MSYLVLARKYRSATFDEVVGQNHVAQTLKKAIESGRIAHAYLFVGTRGVGKTSMARILAKALNCEKAKAPTSEPCGKCKTCEAIARGEDMDVIEIDAASNTQVDKTREVILDNAQYRPARGRFKVYIIDEVHMLSKASFNALLKTLEEPPEHVKFILATTEVEKVLPTILSRCQRYDFRNIPTREIAGHLKNICKDEKIKADEEALMLVAKAGAGSMRDALSLLDRLLSIGEKHLTVQTLEQLLGLPRGEMIRQLVQHIGEGRIKDVLSQADRMLNEGLSVDGLLAALIDHFRNLLILRTCGSGSDLVEAAGVAVEELEKQAQQFDPVVLTQDITVLEDLRRQLRSSQAGRALLDATLVRLAMAEQFASIGELMSRMDGGAEPSQKKKPEPAVTGGTGNLPVTSSSVPQEPAASIDTTDDEDDLPRPGRVFTGSTVGELLKQSASPPAAAPLPRRENPPSNIEPVNPDNLPAVWGNLLRLLQQQSAALHSLVASGKFLGIVDNQAIIKFAPAQETFLKMLVRNGKKEQIIEAVSKVVGRNVGVRLELDESAQPPEPPQTSAADQGSGAVASAPREQRRPMPAPPPAMAASQPARLTPEQIKEVAQDPLVAALMNELDATPLKFSDE